MCSFLLHYIIAKMGSVKHLHIFSDQCGAQNKNHTLVRMGSALVSLRNCWTILPDPRAFLFTLRPRFRSFKKKKKKSWSHLHYRRLCHFDRFEVITAEAKDFINFKAWWPKHYKKTMLSIESIGRNVAKDGKIS